MGQFFESMQIKRNYAPEITVRYFVKKRQVEKEIIVTLYITVWVLFHGPYAQVTSMHL